MLRWPWTNVEKVIKQRKKDHDELQTVMYTVTDIRSMLDDIRNQKRSFVEQLWNRVCFKTHEMVWDVYRFFNPCHKRIRKTIPRQWCDLVEVVLMVNFEIIKSYVEEEMDSVDWSHGVYAQAAEWLRKSYTYIVDGRPKLLLEMQQAYDRINYKSEAPYETIYGEVNLIEDRIREQDKQVLMGLAEYREFLWS